MNTMSQVTLYLDEDTAARMKQAAQREGVSQSQWVAGLIRERTRTQWPPEVAGLAGAWADLPLAEEIRKSAVADVEREPF
jgi:hypothetical protein